MAQFSFLSGTRTSLDSSATMSDEAAANTNARRKVSKPLMEKKRRARINQSLDELKFLILEATMKKDIPCNSKLEKADILEMTVRYLKNLRKYQETYNSQRDPQANYRAGFNECAGEITRYLATIDGVSIDWKTTLLEHLAACCHAPTSGSPVFKTPLGVPYLPSMRRGPVPEPTSHALSWLQRKQGETFSRCGEPENLRPLPSGNLSDARLAAILVPSATSPFLLTTPEPLGKPDLAPVLCKGPTEISPFSGAAESLGPQSKVWRPF